MTGGMGILGLQRLGEGGFRGRAGVSWRFWDPQGRFRRSDPVGSGGAAIRQRIRTPTAGKAVPVRLACRAQLWPGGIRIHWMTNDISGKVTPPFLSYRPALTGRFTDLHSVVGR